MKRFLILILLFFISFQIYSQPKALSSSEIYQGIQRLGTVGNVMYIAAHPDDENTLMITWLSKEKNVRTAYFAMTRGDGGQNLIGAEQGEYVGLLRTHELLEARKVDGGEQYFSRALDFGFSKSTEETLEFWGKDQILSDLVYRIRKLQPDIIINRFPPDERAGHGHHSSSAVLSIEAFDAAADPNRFPEQLSEVGVWQAKRLVWNTFSPGFTNDEPEKGSFIKVPLGDFNPILGESYTEIAAEARSKHRSQGFGSAPTRGERYDYLVHVKGVPAKEDPFDDIDLSWNRVKGGEKIADQIRDIDENYDFKNPAASLPALLKVYSDLEKMPGSVYKQIKLDECVNLIFACAGIYIEANTGVGKISPGNELKGYFTAVKRTSVSVKLVNLNLLGVVKTAIPLNLSLENNVPQRKDFTLNIPLDAAITQPYWLKKEKNRGSYNLVEEKYRNLAMAPDELNAEFKLEILNTPVSFKHPVKYKYTEPSRGEIYKYFEVVPEVTLHFDQDVLLFTKDEPKKVGVVLKNEVGKNQVNVRLDVPKDWSYSPSRIEVDFDSKGQEKIVYFQVTPSKSNPEGAISARAVNSRGVFELSHKSIQYEHVPELNVYPPATAKALYLDVEVKNKKIAYIMGAGDEVPHALSQIGCEVGFLDENSIKDNLSGWDAIVVGVRAYNVHDWLVGSQNALLEYVKNGGTLIVQYQTQAFFGTIKTDNMGPFPLKISRGRVTEEDAAVTFINPDLKILNYPNKITQKDFDGWVQERGLYFADQWSPEYLPVLSMHDTGEDPLEGSLLYAEYGNGHFIFTGLSLFRQLPAGVPGAYRLMANFLSIGK